WAQSLPLSFDRNHAIQRILASWVGTDPQKAADKALEMQGRWRNDTIGIVAREWANIDPDAVIAWVKTLPPGATQNTALWKCSAQLAQANPAAAADLFNSIPPQPMRDNHQFTSEIATYWAQEDLPSALAWAEQLSEGKDRQIALMRICEQWINTDAPAAGAYAQKLPAGGNRDDLLVDIAGSWANNDRPAALKWAAQLTDD